MRSTLPAAAILAISLTSVAFATEPETPPGSLEKLKVQATEAANQAVAAAKAKAEELTQQTKPTAETVTKAVKADIHAIGAWEYAVELIQEGPEASPEKITEKLNARGADRWECLAVLPRPDGILFTFKRPKLSVSGTALKLGGR